MWEEFSEFEELIKTPVLRGCDRRHETKVEQ